MELEKEPTLEARSEEEAKARQEKLEDYSAKFEEAMSESGREAQKTAAQIQETRQSVRSERSKRWYRIQTKRSIPCHKKNLRKTAQWVG